MAFIWTLAKHELAAYLRRKYSSVSDEKKIFNASSSVAKNFFQNSEPEHKRNSEKQLRHL